MSLRRLTYSQIVAWLKVLLPLIALCLLATLFLFARGGDEIASLPFAEIELEEKVRDQGITQPYFSGLSIGGDAVSLSAFSARPDPQNAGISIAESVHAVIDFSVGSQTEFHANWATVDARKQIAVLDGDVEIRSTNGLNLSTETLSFDMVSGGAVANTTVTGDSPAGSFTSGALEFLPAKGEDGPRFLFKNGVKLLYLPHEAERKRP